ncbi:MAG: CoxG family protein [Gaiellaceae bacterium]
MRVEGTRSFAAARETVWDVLNDPSRLARTMPGVEGFEVEDERRWQARVAIPLGLGALRMSIQFEKTGERPSEYAQLSAKGIGVGALMQMTTAFDLSDGEDGGTSMRWEADVRIAGPVGSMGQRVLQPIVNQQVKNVLTALDVQVQEAVAARRSLDAETPPQTAGSGGGTAGAADSSLAADARTDPELKDVGPPAEPGPGADPAEIEGSSAAEEGVSPWHEEAYSEEPQGPTQSTEDP